MKMGLKKLFLFSCIVGFSLAQEINNKAFPEDFFFATATASYQVEGGWDADGKGENIWDNLTHTSPDLVFDHSNGDIACDSYHKYKEDVALLKELGVSHYRLSISWARILPSVKYWFTFNEPKQICLEGYEYGIMAPAYHSSGIGDYICTHNYLKAHARAYHIYDEEFRPTQGGKVSVAIDSDWYEPESDSEEDEIAAETKRQFVFGWYVNAIFNGDYPEVMKTRIAARSTLEGYAQSRLPAFTDEELAYIKGTHDFLGINFYSSALVRAIPEPAIGSPSWDLDGGVVDYQPDDWPASSSSWIKITPWGFKKHLLWINKTYNNPGILITENGVSDDGTSLDDQIRIDYYREHLSQLRDVLEDGVTFLGYTAWSLMDNFEWMRGYSEKFGLYHVDFTSPNRTRTPKKSVEYFKKVVKTRCLVDTCVPHK